MAVVLAPSLAPSLAPATSATDLVSTKAQQRGNVPPPHTGPFITEEQQKDLSLSELLQLWQEGGGGPTSNTLTGGFGGGEYFPNLKENEVGGPTVAVALAPPPPPPQVHQYLVRSVPAHPFSIPFSPFSLSLSIIVSPFVFCSFIFFLSHLRHPILEWKE
jgi:hypothetical protein